MWGYIIGSNGPSIGVVYTRVTSGYRCYSTILRGICLGLKATVYFKSEAILFRFLLLVYAFLSTFLFILFSYPQNVTSMWFLISFMYHWTKWSREIFDFLRRLGHLICDYCWFVFDIPKACRLFQEPQDQTLACLYSFCVFLLISNYGHEIWQFCYFCLLVFLIWWKIEPVVCSRHHVT